MLLSESTETKNKKFEAAECWQKHSFLFETLCPLDRNLNKTKKQIFASNPSEIFSSLNEVETFLSENHHKFKGSQAGIAGYISYEGRAEFALYEKINMEIEKVTRKTDNKDFSFKILKPSKKSFIDSVLKCQEYIKVGDIYQANITRKYLIEISRPSNFLKPLNEESLGLFAKELYLRLSETNPAPYAGYMNFDKHLIISSSPESFLKIYRKQSDGGKVYISTCPIKGTSGLTNTKSLKHSDKEQAEHIMIVDLERNDLGKICKTGSIKVEEMMQIHSFSNLHHYISTISGELKENLYKDGFKIDHIFNACFPGGSITGTPKLRAMEIIKELEPVPRGPYTGSMGYLLLDQNQSGYAEKQNNNIFGEFNIIIRSIVIDKGSREISFHSGAGITAYSDPEKELKETELKAEKILEIFK